ncbi:MAG: heavy-metal-associated domain-containing protein [Candidatus Heimdallarchaeota archaeon]|nr:heavy-metal-associated domain-containing protein [Candidatus Heimdallarchaeota archaeon]
MNEVKLNIEGMTCGHCQMTVANALKKISGVKEVEVNLETNSAKILFKPGKTNDEKLIKAVEAAGYKAAVA